MMSSWWAEMAGSGLLALLQAVESAGTDNNAVDGDDRGGCGSGDAAAAADVSGDDVFMVGEMAGSGL